MIALNWPETGAIIVLATLIIVVFLVLRYLANGLRQTFELPGVPIRIALREKANPFAGRAKKR